jgi:hypothetical protein
VIVGVRNYDIFLDPKAKTMRRIELALTWTQLAILATNLHGPELAYCSTRMMENSCRCTSSAS